MQAFVNPYSLTEEEVQALIHALLAFACRAECRGPGVRWDRMADSQPDLSRYPPETLRVYMNLCNSFWLLQDFEDRGDCFVVNGLTQMGEVRQKTRRRMKVERLLNVLLNMLVMYYLLQAIPPSMRLEPFNRILSLFSSLFG